MGGHNDNQRWERLLVWLKEQHGMHIGSDDLLVECKDVEGAGRGLFARKACPPSSTLFKVPVGALINADTLAVIYPQAHHSMIAILWTLRSDHTYRHYLGIFLVTHYRG
ncbi:hypothetical protein A0H81_04379 [Grifola frondosa]|uniref:Uncharacterized protein n=1 Tax=Grifola frondosa TaxID=5627 RepID=A0A1C7MG06_GRIFR|nr:hypothetical protein A0H81_04379 [Grifola frondosa]